jgi:hypothetical protein
MCFAVLSFTSLNVDALGTNRITIREFIESCYILPYNIANEMTDVVLINAAITNQNKIQQIASEIIHKYTTNENPSEWDSLLDAVFMETGIAQNANVQQFRERSTGDYYRIDFAPPLPAFSNFDWDDGQFTNYHPFLAAHVSTPPIGTNNWMLYTIQPQNDHVTVQTGENRLLAYEGFYFELFGLPSLFRFNVLLETADPKSGAGVALVNPTDPKIIHASYISEKRLQEVLQGKSSFGKWVFSERNDGNGQVSELTFVSANGIDHDGMRVLFRGNDLNRPYLAYVRDPNSRAIISLSAWSYGAKGDPLRTVHIHASEGTLSYLQLQNIIYSQKTTNIDWAAFAVDISKFKSIYDLRPEYPIQTVNGKVTFDARKDKYGSILGKTGSVHSNVFKNVIVIRAIMLTMFLLPVLTLAFFAFRKVNSK